LTWLILAAKGSNRFIVGLRYCGGCNPEIDRTGLIFLLKEGLKKIGLNVEIVTLGKNETDVVLLVNGCKHACLEEKYPIFNEGPLVISVKGDMVDTECIEEKEIPEFIINKIDGLVKSPNLPFS